MRTAEAVHTKDELNAHSARWHAPTWEETTSRPPLTFRGMNVAHWLPWALIVTAAAAHEWSWL